MNDITDTTSTQTSLPTPPRIVCVDAVFLNNNTRYSYFVPDGEEPKVGDLILTSVQIKTRGHNEYLYITDDEEGAPDGKLARIVETHTIAQPKATKHYLMLIPFGLIHERRKQNETWIKKRKAAAELRTAIDKRVSQLDKMRIYERAAESDPETRALLEQLKAVGER